MLGCIVKYWELGAQADGFYFSSKITDQNRSNLSIAQTSSLMDGLDIVFTESMIDKLSFEFGEFTCNGGQVLDNLYSFIVNGKVEDIHISFQVHGL